MFDAADVLVDGHPVVDSSWYFLRYVSPDLDDAPFDAERANDWMPVDQYVGGLEHAVMHLLYARFATKAVSDMGTLEHREPFTNLLGQGMVQLEGEKMSKSTGNTVSPQRIVEEYGADTARLFMMQAARPDTAFDWSEEGVKSTHRFLGRLAETVRSFAGRDSGTAEEDDPAARYVRSEVDAAVAVATENFDDLGFDLATREAQQLVATLRGYREYVEEVHAPTFERGLQVAIRLLAPVAPHLTEELYAELNGADAGLLVDAEWPTADVDTDEARRRRQLVENTRDDVRNIVDVAGIEEPDRVDVVVAPEWKHEALETAIDSDADNLVGELMRKPEIQRHGSDASDYAKELQAGREALRPALSPAREREALAAAAWLIEREFDAPVRVIAAEAADDGVASTAEPGRPAIDIVE